MKMTKEQAEKILDDAGAMTIEAYLESLYGQGRRQMLRLNAIYRATEGMSYREYKDACNRQF